CRSGRSKVHVTVGRDGGRVTFAIEDDGPGLAAGERETIFQPGARGQAGRDAAGAGLGLALARRLARSASGDVSAETNGAGARFLVSLPAARAHRAVCRRSGAGGHSVPVATATHRPRRVPETYGEGASVGVFRLG